MLTKDTAICIRAIDYSETSQILTFFTRLTGKIDAIAKGSKRPKSSFDGPIEVFSYGRIVFSPANDGKLSTLTEFEQQQTFSSLSGDIFALNCCLFAAELLNSLTDDYDPHPGLFDSFLQFLQNVSELRTTNHDSQITIHKPRFTSHEPRATISLLILFQLSLLKEVGLQPVLNHCVNCKTSYASRTTIHERRFTSHEPRTTLHDPRPTNHAPRTTSDELYFSSSANGLVCKDCEPAFTEKIKLSPQSAKCLSNLKLIARADERTLKEIEKILIYHFTELLHKPPKMAKHITRGS
jgi:recombinational DNA repair protein (RecF pathway)